MPKQFLDGKTWEIRNQKHPHILCWRRTICKTANKCPGSNLAQSGSSGFTVPPADHFPNHQINNFNQYTCSWQNFYTGFLTYKNYHSDTGQVEALKIILSQDGKLQKKKKNTASLWE